MRRLEYSFFRRACSTTIVGFLLAACGDGAADPRTVRGALAAAAQAIEARDATMLFRVIDQRSRHAMASIVTSRGAAKRLIEADYPQNARANAVAALGDAALAASAAELFARRCDAPCMAGFSTQIGAPTSEEKTGGDVVVQTSRGGTLHMHAGNDGWYGLVWNTEALAAERTTAARELEQIRENTAVYRKQRALTQ